MRKAYVTQHYFQQYSEVSFTVYFYVTLLKFFRSILHQCIELHLYLEIVLNASNFLISAFVLHLKYFNWLKILLQIGLFRLFLNFLFHLQSTYLHTTMFIFIIVSFIILLQLTSIWTCLEHVIYKKHNLLKDRHLDQVFFIIIQLFYWRFKYILYLKYSLYTFLGFNVCHKKMSKYSCKIL